MVVGSEARGTLTLARQVRVHGVKYVTMRWHTMQTYQGDSDVCEVFYEQNRKWSAVSPELVHFGYNKPPREIVAMRVFWHHAFST